MTRLVASRPVIAPHERPVFLREVITALPAGVRVLDAGCGPGSWPYSLRDDLDVSAFDIKFPPGPPPRGERVRVFRGDLARLPLRAGTFDLVVCHYVLEHVTALAACCDELARVVRPGGQLYLSVPRAAAFDDRLYRFAGVFAKYALLKFKKRLEHQQRFDFHTLIDLFYARGLRLTATARVPAGFSWMNDPRTKPLQGAFTNTLAWVHRTFGSDLAKDANFVLTFEKVGEVGLRHVTHVCRECGEHAVVTKAGTERPADPAAAGVKRFVGGGITQGDPAPSGARDGGSEVQRHVRPGTTPGRTAQGEAPPNESRSDIEPNSNTWICPYCGKPNPYGRPR